MKGDSKVIEHLNTILGNELVAINQYFLHAKMFEDWGLKELAEYTREESIDEMKHADHIIDRILFLEGLPNLQDLGKLHIGEHTEEMLRCDLDLEMRAIPDLRAAIAYSESVQDYVSRDLFRTIESVQDYVSRDLFRTILDDEEKHVDWIEAQLYLIENMGIQNYLSEKMDEGGN